MSAEAGRFDAAAERGSAAAGAAADVPFRGGGFQPRRLRHVGWIGFAVLLALWQAAIGLGLLNPVFLPSPWSVAVALAHLIISGELAQNLSASLWRLLGGWAFGTFVGIVIGGAMGLSSIARSLGMPLISALFPIPKIALLPLLILWFGIGEPSKIATIGLGVFFPTAIATFSSMDAVPRNLIRMAQSFNLPVHDIITKVLLPGALPGLLAGMRISASIALLLLVAAEMIGAQRGIGVLVLTAGNLMQTDRLMAGVAILSLLGLAIGAALSACERRLLRWR
ncbi:MAG: ABC transporter permease [Alphaproteobacteria bacterium]|nr:ABC transporter permease [Alphaproteobacteria bacterium]